MSKFTDMLESLDEACKCKCGKGKDCKCKKGKDCDGKCDCKKDVKEDIDLDEKKMSDDEGDEKMHVKKDDAQGEKCPKCGSTKGYVKGKCLGCPMKESKFDKYILECEEADLLEKEEQLMEGMVAGDVRKEILAAGLGIGIPSSGLTVDAYRNILSKLQAKGMTDLASKLKSGITWSPVEQQNMKKF
jgi:hypothetical protein